MKYAGLMLVVVCAVQAGAQVLDKGGYSSMSIPTEVDMTGSFGSGMQLDEMTGGVEVVLHSSKKGEPDLPISANTMKFDWEEGSNKPTRIILQGGVRIKHPQADVSSERAEWDFKANQLVFTGNVVMRSQAVSEARFERMTLDFATNRFTGQGSRISRLEFGNTGGGAAGGGDAGGGGGALGDADVTDWQALIQGLKDQTAGGGASPGKYIVSLVDKALVEPLQTKSAEELVAQKGLLLDQLNKLMRKPSFYNAEAWAGVTVPAEVQAQAARTDLTAAERGQVNRALLHAAFPNAVAAP
jgi:hypothetical protein